MTAQDQQSRAELLPCPFCGEPAEMIRHAPIFHVRCRQWACGCHGSSTFEYSPEKAIISWNRRVPAAPVAADSRVSNGDNAAPVRMPDAVGSTYTMEALVPGGRTVCHVTLHRSLPAGTNLYAEPDVRALLASARGVPEPVAGQCRFSGVNWAECSVEHVRMVLAAPQEWQGYEVRYLYAAAPKEPAP